MNDSRSDAGYTDHPSLIRTLLRSHPRLSALLFGGCCALAILCCVEGAFYLLNRPSRLDEYDNPAMFQPDRLLGYKAIPDARIAAKKVNRKSGDLVYDVVYSTDSLSRRIVPGRKADQHPAGLIIYLGCSYTFGEGVNDDETMPFDVSQLAPDYVPYNYGFRGYGPQQMLAKLQSSALTQEVERTGHAIAVYTFMNDHVRRAIGAMRDMSFASHHPYYSLDQEDTLVRHGSFASGRPMTTLLYRVLSRSQTLDFFKADWPSVTDADVRFTARIIAESQRLFREQFVSDEFYVLIYPGASRYGDLLVPYLAQAGIKYLDYSASSLSQGRRRCLCRKELRSCRGFG